MSETPWYQDGLRFKCTQCGDCCTGAPGYVWVNKKEIAGLAATVGLEDDIEKFERLYVRSIGIRKSLKEFPNGDCIFFDSESRRCTAYEARPRQCRTWPFWDSNLKSPEHWQETCAICPGSGTGKLYQLEEIESSRKVMKI
ncbi:MAG: YkgJ family cysteine cluster protein [Planctomycetes bacterium]|nr:YkgJ family cysteine cluster protein [Planctomycetota bacterium]